MRPEAGLICFRRRAWKQGKHCAAGWSSPYLFVAHDRENAEYFRGKIWLPDRAGMLGGSLFGECSPARPERDMEIRRLGEEYFRNHQCKLQHLFWRGIYTGPHPGRCHAGAFGTVCCWGLPGMHPEGSVGMLEVLPEYRRQGAATALMAAMVNFCLERGCVPFSQIFAGNEASPGTSSENGIFRAAAHVWVMNND